MDHATSASPATAAAIQRGLSLGCLEPGCAVARESAVAPDEEEESSNCDGDEEDKAQEQQERQRHRTRRAEGLCGKQDRRVEGADVARARWDQRYEVRDDHDEHG